MPPPLLLHWIERGHSHPSKKASWSPQNHCPLLLSFQGTDHVWEGGRRGTERPWRKKSCFLMYCSGAVFCREGNSKSLFSFQIAHAITLGHKHRAHPTARLHCYNWAWRHCCKRVGSTQKQKSSKSWRCSSQLVSLIQCYNQYCYKWVITVLAWMLCNKNLREGSLLLFVPYETWKWKSGLSTWPFMKNAIHCILSQCKPHNTAVSHYTSRVQMQFLWEDWMNR